MVLTELKIKVKKKKDGKLYENYSGGKWDMNTSPLDKSFWRIHSATTSLYHWKWIMWLFCLQSWLNLTLMNTIRYELMKQMRNLFCVTAYFAFMWAWAGRSNRTPVGFEIFQIGVEDEQMNNLLYTICSKEYTTSGCRTSSCRWNIKIVSLKVIVA